MAVCGFCKQEMTHPDTVDCTWNRMVAYPEGEPLPAIPYRPENEAQRCHDCNVAKGGFHHPGCDMERCPKCHGQLIGCGCLDDGEDE